VDVIDSTRSFDKYDVLVAPMLYLLRDGTAERIDAFVQRGGTFIATYASGYVNESTLAFLGGFPGPLKETLGVWCEEIDALFPEDSNSIKWQGKSYRAFDLCELIHPQGAEVLGAYGSDFYAGQAALTCNKRGKGRAYFIAARTGADFLGDFYRLIVKEAGIKPVLADPLPAGVTAQVRDDGKTESVFIMNFTDKDKQVKGPSGAIALAPFEVKIIERDSQSS
jgi:beta-galactosidase